MLRQVRPEIDLAAIEAGGDGLLRWLRLLRDYSCVFVRGVPTRVGAVLDLAERIAFVQETNFGRSFQVVSKPDPENLAFTSAKLTAHTDVPNRRALPGLQLLHCIEFKARGGESILIGGYWPPAARASRTPRRTTCSRRSRSPTASPTTTTTSATGPRSSGSTATAATPRSGSIRRSWRRWTSIRT